MHKLILSTAIALVAIAPSSAFSQEEQQSTQEAFAPENAIVDTSIPFAIGAREARQELRGAFGWPTFQEGLVEGVYFRFDPDGYARFAPTPRLDTDVFEVICRAGTLNCHGRKGVLSVYLNGQGALQLQINDTSDGDTMFLIDGASELQLPKRVLGPLDERMELLLGSGGELLVRRGEIETVRLSLAGFSAVAAYLRWITARQDYGVLPRGWPVPNSTVPQSDPIAVNWQVSPAAQQNQPIFERDNNQSSSDVEQDVAAVRTEISELRELLSTPAGEASPSSTIDQALVQQDGHAIKQTNQETDLQIQQLQDTARALLDAAESLNAQSRTTTVETTLMPETPEDSPTQIGNQLAFLMTEFGLDAQTALTLLQSKDNSLIEAGIATQRGVEQESTEMTEQLGSQGGDDIVLDIISELRDELPDVRTTEPKTPSIGNLSNTPQEYELLTDYFLSVFSDS